MIRSMEERTTQQRQQRVPKCGAKCLCKGGRRIVLDDGSEMRFRYRYCSSVFCDGTIKQSQTIEYIEENNVN